MEMSGQFHAGTTLLPGTASVPTKLEVGLAPEWVWIFCTWKTKSLAPAQNWATVPWTPNL